MNSSHWHLPVGEKDESKLVEADGLREHCDTCREKAGQKPLNTLERRLADAGVLGAKAGESGSGSVQQDEALRMLEEQEGINDALREEIKGLRDENALLKASLAKKQGKDS